MLLWGLTRTNVGASLIGWISHLWSLILVLF